MYNQHTELVIVNIYRAEISDLFDESFQAKPYHAATEVEFKVVSWTHSLRLVKNNKWRLTVSINSLGD
jgi:hypothetical protein